MLNTGLHRIFLVSVLTLISIPANAELITHHGYTLNTETNIVTGNGLEWLQWDVTVGQSMSSALDTFSPNGWKLASNENMKDLFSNFFPEKNWDQNENTRQGHWTAWRPTESSVTNDFITLFGDTLLAGGEICCDPADLHSGSLARFGRDSDGDGYYNYAYVYDDWLDNGTKNGAQRVLTQDKSWATFSFSSLVQGVALVRNAPIIQQSNVSVPEPGPVMLMAIGLFSLLLTTSRR